MKLVVSSPYKTRPGEGNFRIKITAGAFVVPFRVLSRET